MTVRIQAYRGIGTGDAIYLLGRVVRESNAGRSFRKGSPTRMALGIVRRALRRGVPRTEVEATIAGQVLRTETDRLGYFRFHDRLEAPLEPRAWHEMVLRAPRTRAEESTGEIFVAPSDAPFVVVSDIDDTIMRTGVVNKAVMLWRLFMQGARTRVAFPGMAALCRALHAGPDGTGANPMLYVSRAPWSLYDTIGRFFGHHSIPVGPVLFLRDWGLHLQHPLPRRGRDHKIALIRDMMALHAPLPFVLIGDSGQRDPELYAQVVHEHPGRIKAIYIRNVSKGADRRRAIEALAEEVVDAHCTMLLAADTFAMAEHAAEHGLIAPDHLKAVMAEKIEDEVVPDVRPTRHVAGEQAAENAKTVADLDDANIDIESTPEGAQTQTLAPTPAHRARTHGD